MQFVFEIILTHQSDISQVRTLSLLERLVTPNNWIHQIHQIRKKSPDSPVSPGSQNAPDTPVSPGSQNAPETPDTQISHISTFLLMYPVQPLTSSKI